MMRPRRNWILTSIVAIVVAYAAPLPAEAQQATCGGQTPTITGTEGDDTLTGTAGADIIVGLGGNDTISGAGAADQICGDAGTDRARKPSDTSHWRRIHRREAPGTTTERCLKTWRSTSR
jgi:hypothetical protein